MEEPVVAVQDPEVQQNLPPEIPPAPPEAPPAPPPDNWQTKAAQLEQELRTYQQQMGAYIQQQQQQYRPPAPPTADRYSQLASKFDAETLELIDLAAERKAQKIAEETGHRFVTQQQHRQLLEGDQELLAEGNKVYAALKANPLWASQPEVIIQDRAIMEARLNLTQRKQQLSQTYQAQQQVTQANRQQSQVANLPGTGNQPAVVDEKERFIRTWMAQPESVEMYKRFNRGLDINSPEGQAKFRKVAETAWKPVQFGGAVGLAMNALQNSHVEVLKP